MQTRRENIERNIFEVVYDGFKECAFKQHVDTRFVALKDTLERTQQHLGTSTCIGVVAGTNPLIGKESIKKRQITKTMLWPNCR